MATGVPYTQSAHEDARLWLVSGIAAALLAVLLLLAFGMTVLASVVREIPPPAPEPEPGAVILLPALPKPAAPPSPERKPFARTPAAAPERKPDRPAYQGERNTNAASETAPAPAAPPLPSQTGAQRKHEQLDLESTRFQDAEPSPADPEPAPRRQGSPASAAAPPPDSRPLDPLLAGPMPVDVPVTRPQPEPAEETPPAPRIPPVEEIAKPEPEPAKPADPAFRSEQRKTELVGSISRGKQSSLEVEDTPLGRYQAAVSRAVELEWQRNCVRHRDFIVPGFLTARFTVAADGNVASVQFEGEMEGGQVQKGFTLDSIRKAEIPAMPATLRKEHSRHPLELTFRFFF